MPKEKETNREFFARIVKDYPGVFRTDNSLLFCTYCNCSVAGAKLFSVKQHIATDKHQKIAKLRGICPKNSQTLLTEYQQPLKINPFNMEMCKMFVEANIPLKKVAHPSVVKFFETFTFIL